METKKQYTIATVLLLAGLAGCFGCSRQGMSALATIGSRVITTNEFKERIQQLPAQYQSLIRNDEDKKVLLEAMVKEQLIVQEARERNIDKDKAIRNKIDAVVNQVLLEEMIQKARSTHLQPTEADLKAYYEQHQQEYSGGERVKVAHILVREKAEAEKLLTQLRQGADFGELARKNSGDPGSNEKGGEMEYFSRGEMVPEFEKASFGLDKPGQLSGVVKSPFGYHLIKLLAKKPAGVKTFDECRKEISKVLEKEKFEKWMESLKTKWRVKMNYDRLPDVNLASAPMSAEGEK